MKSYNEYDEILFEAEIKKKQKLNEIERKFCSYCLNRGKNCLRLEHIFKSGKEIYRCTNYKV